MRRGLALAALAVGACRSARIPPSPAPSPSIAHAPPIDAAAPAATAPPTGCIAAATDADARHGGAELDDTTVDLDGDGVADPIFRACYGVGNCDYLIYVAGAPGCARFAGELHGAIFAHPWCVAPGTAAAPCRLSLMRFMIHGDSQEYFYDFVGGAYVESGSGRYIPPPSKEP